MRIASVRRRLVGYFACITIMPILGCTLLFMLWSVPGVGGDSAQTAGTLLARFASPSLMLVTVAWSIGLVTLACCILMANSITEPLRAAVAFAKALTAGERMIPIEIDSTDREFQALAGALLHLRDQLRTHEAELQRKSADEAMGQIAAQVAHDMRAPATVLRSVFRWLRGREEASGCELHSEPGLQAVAKLETLAANMLDVARARRLQCESTVLGPFLDTVTATLRAGLGERDIDIVVDTRTPAALDVDRNKLDRVLTNLLQNAVQAIPLQQQGRVAVTTTEGDAWITIAIRDNGCGIAEEDRAHLFEKYFTTKGSAGNGLGLAYCKDVIEAHGGEMRVESVVGMGSTFTIVLPKAPPQVLAAQCKAAQMAPHA